MTSLTLFLRACYLLSLLRPMLPLVGGLAISSDGYFCPELTEIIPNHHQIGKYPFLSTALKIGFVFSTKQPQKYHRSRLWICFEW